MTENRSDSGRQLLAACGSLVGVAVICAACVACGYFFWTADLSELTLGDTNIAQAVGLVEPTSTPTLTASPTATATPGTATATSQPTDTPTMGGSPTIPPTDTPRPRPTATPTSTFTPTPLDSAAEIDSETASLTELEPDLAATAIADAIINILTGPQAIEGTLSLIAIENGYVFPPGAGEAEFSWTWSGAAGCDPPPVGFGFEVRIWPNRPDFGPLGVDDAKQLQDKIFCDPQTGRRSFKLGFLSNTPAVQIQGAGSFAWDVAFIQMEPHTPLYASPPRIFEISLVYPNPGRFDPHGQVGAVKCSSFVAWSEAQAFFIAAGPGDRHKLDTDRDGVACNEIAPCLLTQPVEVCRTKF
jgi:hypothetical protein